MEQADFINLYINKLVNEITELTKTKILLQTKEASKDVDIEELNKKLVELEQTSAKEKDEVAQTWQIALNEKDEETNKILQQLADYRRQLDVKSNQLESTTAKLEELQKEVKTREETIVRLESFSKKLAETKPVKRVKTKANKKTVDTVTLE